MPFFNVNLFLHFKIQSFYLLLKNILKCRFSLNVKIFVFTYILKNRIFIYFLKNILKCRFSINVNCFLFTFKKIFLTVAVVALMYVCI